MQCLLSYQEFAFKPPKCFDFYQDESEVMSTDFGYVQITNSSNSPTTVEIDSKPEKNNEVKLGFLPEVQELLIMEALKTWSEPIPICKDCDSKFQMVTLWQNYVPKFMLPYYNWKPKKKTRIYVNYDPALLDVEQELAKKDMEDVGEFPVEGIHKLDTRNIRKLSYLQQRKLKTKKNFWFSDMKEKQIYERKRQLIQELLSITADQDNVIEVG
jgi:hypothetical protein